MLLTRLQRKTLEQYRSFHDAPLSVGRLFALSAWPHVKMIFGVAVLASFAFYADVTSVGFVAIGMGIGALSRNFGQFRRYVEVWPVLATVLDWPKIDELLAEEHHNIRSG